MRKGGEKEACLRKISKYLGGGHYYRVSFSGPEQASRGKKSDDEVAGHQTSVYNIASFGGVRYIFKGCDARVAT